MTAEQAQAKLLECRPHTNSEIYKREVVSIFIQQLDLSERLPGSEQ